MSNRFAVKDTGPSGHLWEALLTFWSGSLAYLRPRHLLDVALHDAIALPQQHDAGNVGAGGLLFELGEGGDDDHVAGVRQVRRGAVDAHDPRAGRAGDGVGAQPAAARHVPDVD